MNQSYPQVAARAGFRCEYCHAPQAVSNSHFEVEHVWPQSRGGLSEPENLALACAFCNVFKGAAVEALDPFAGVVSRLFHPRLDVWSDHFKVDAAWQIFGLTPVGRATVERLRMNRDLALLARGYWAMLGLFP